MGRIAQSKEEKALKGTGNQTRENRRSEPEYPIGTQLATYNEATKEVTIPVAPDDLSDSAKMVWDLNGYQIASMHLFPNSAYGYLHNFCRLHDVINDSWAEYRGEKYLWTDKGVKYTNPAYKDYTTALSMYVAIGAKFGFTPADKTKLNTKLLSEGSIKDKNDGKKYGANG